MDIARFYASRYLSPDERKMEAFFRLIEDHFREAHDPKFYANRLGISYRHLSRMTTLRLGKTPKDCLQERLHEEVLRLLKYTRLPMKQITYELGICDPSHFSRCFRKLLGVSPARYRENYLKGIAAGKSGIDDGKIVKEQ